jgi:hypothetical protein
MDWMKSIDLKKRKKERKKENVYSNCPDLID